jgi:3',5'-cyclic AMP phosphodiesterase CpdA
MKRLFLAAVAVSFLVAAMAMSGNQRQVVGDLEIQTDKRNPWTSLKLNNSPDTFHFAVVSDRTGGHRARIFSQAIEQLNMLQPAFVVSVGDLIEGYTKEPAALAEQWKELQGYVHKLQMPFFYVPGNHDVANAVEAKEWEARFGRRYYHFLYKDVLFLILCTDDPYEHGSEGRMSKEQAAWADKVLKENAKARWTIVALHKPIWTQKNLEKSGWLDIEKALAGRSYTVFAGHIHRYQKFTRNGMSYYQLATTGGVSKMRGLAYGEFDHIAWVTMKQGGPVIANILLDGIYPENMQMPITAEDTSIRYNRKPTQPVRGTVLMEGAPVAGAKVVFYALEKAGKQKSYAGDALTDPDGTFTISTYQANDGAPVGDYAVTVVLREPFFDASGNLGPNRLPAKYASVEATNLEVHVKSGANDFALNLSK